MPTFSIILPEAGLLEKNLAHTLFVKSKADYGFKGLSEVFFVGWYPACGCFHWVGVWQIQSCFVNVVIVTHFINPLCI